MNSLSAHEAKLTAIEILLEQLYVQQFRNVLPARAADSHLAEWEQAAIDILKDHPDSANYAKEFYGEIRGALEHIRSKQRGA